jgi:hypothetical protein
MRAQSPIDVHEYTKEKVRYGALMATLERAELVDRVGGVASLPRSSAT